MNSSSPISDPFDAVFLPYRAGCNDEPGIVALAPGPPTDLDPLILADAETRADSATVRWYSGLEAAGAFRIFRFQPGRSIDAWRELLKSQIQQGVAGPFRTRWDADAVVHAATHVQAGSGQPGRLISGSVEIICASGQPGCPASTMDSDV